MAGHDIVVVGFSAGGMDPLRQMVADLPRDFPAAIFVVHHFPSHSISALPSILARASRLPVAQAADGDQISPGHIYVARPDQHLLLRADAVRLTRGPREHGHRPAVDPLFRTAARYFGPRVVGVVLSGTMDDGTAGLHAIKAAGGIAVVQDPEHCAYPGMPASGARGGAGRRRGLDPSPGRHSRGVGAARGRGGRMSRSRPSPGDTSLPDDPATLAEFESLLAYLKQSRGFDFTAYKRSSLMRRVLVRMQTLGVKTFANYQDLLQVDTDEFTRLFNTILINVTSFFRDTQHWDYIRDDVVPRLAGPDGATEPIRVWSAGCASGEEAYSIAMLLAEAVGPEAFRERVKIYATDLDEEALSQARHAAYSAQNAEDVPAPLREKYFDRQDDRYVFNKDLRRSVIFGRHDLIQDAPISRVDMLICRNCLMYLNTETQTRVLARFHFALVPRGILFLGKAETLLAQSQSFEPLDIKRRLFIKADRQMEARYLTFTPPNGHDRSRSLREAATDVAPVAQLVVDREGTVVSANQHLRALFGLTARDIGRPLQDLELSYRPFELRSAIERAYVERRATTAVDGRWLGSGGQPAFLELSVVPLLDTSGTPVGVSVHFVDVSRQHRLQEEVHRVNQELETALEELQSTNEELETTNEELQSTVEELETTNEELQSTNEELETMNEELQSTNEELQTINEEARDRGDQLAELNTFLESILTSLKSAVAVVDRDLHVRKWSRRAEDLWGLRADEVLLKNFLNLDIGLPVDRLRAPIRACLAGEADYTDLVLEAVNRRGRPVQVRVSCTPLSAAPSGQTLGVILLMDETDGHP